MWKTQRNLEARLTALEARVQELEADLLTHAKLAHEESTVVLSLLKALSESESE